MLTGNSAVFPAMTSQNACCEKGLFPAYHCPEHGSNQPEKLKTPVCGFRPEPETETQFTI